VIGKPSPRARMRPRTADLVGARAIPSACRRLCEARGHRSPSGSTKASPPTTGEGAAARSRPGPNPNRWCHSSNAAPPSGRRIDNALRAPLRGCKRPGCDGSRLASMPRSARVDGCPTHSPRSSARVLGARCRRTSGKVRRQLTNLGGT
jgi:hypothetical protein